MDLYHVSPSSSMDPEIEIKPPHDSMFSSFYRSASFIEISRQTEEQQLSIVLDADDTLMNKMSPSISKKMTNFYYSRYSIAFAVVSTIALALIPNEMQFMFLIITMIFLLYLIGVAFVWNYAVLRYAFQHSINLYIICITCIFQIACQWIFKAVNNDLRRGLMARVCLHLALVVAFPLLYTQNGLRLKHRVKQMVIFVVTLTTGWVAINYFLFDPYPEYDDVVFHPFNLDIDISLEDLMLIGQWNIAVFWFQKFMLITSHPDCILIASHPTIVWVNTGSINEVVHSIRDFELRTNSASNRGLQLQRSERISSFSINIYDQAISQNANIYLMEDNSIAHAIWRKKSAISLHRVHFSKKTSLVLFILLLLIGCGIQKDIHILAVIAEILCALLLLIGVLTFDVEMMRFYVKSFDFWFKSFYWALFQAADCMMNGLEYPETKSIEWVVFALRKLTITIFIFYVICIDAYHISQRIKKLELVLALSMAVYTHICTMLQLNLFSPSETWNDHSIVVLGVELSLRSTMMNSLGNFIMFMAKQLAVMLMHPGTAAFELYPKIEWVDEEDPITAKNNEAEFQGTTVP